MSVTGVLVLVTGLGLLASACGGGETPVAAGPVSVSPTSTAGSASAGGSTASTTAPTPTTPGTTEPPGTTTTTELPLPPASPALKAGDNRVFVLADSVLLGAKAEIPTALKGWKSTIDAAESRFITQGVAEMQSKVAAIDRERSALYDEAVAANEAAGQPLPPEPVKATLAEALGRVVVVSLCTNYEAGGGFATYITRYMDTLKGFDRVVWVTCAEWSDGQVEANNAIREAAPTYKNYVVADWALYADRPGYTYQDGIHLDGPGRKAAAELLALAVGPAPKPT